MSVVPNRYYNSPWIAQAGQNLASALAPPDPEKTLLAQQNAWKFDRAQELARMEDEEYAQKGVRQQALGDIITAQGGPEEGTGYPADQAANDAAIDAALQKAIQAGVPINDAMLAAGTRSRKYLQQQGLAEDKYAARADETDRRLGQTMDIFTQAELGRMQRAGIADDRIRDLAANLEQMRRDLTTQTEQGKNLRDATGGTGTALDISPTDDLNLGYAVDDWVSKFDVGALPQDQYRAFKARAAQIYQNTRNSTTAVEQAGRELFGDKPNVTPAYEPLGPDLWRDPTASDSSTCATTRISATSSPSCRRTRQSPRRQLPPRRIRWALVCCFREPRR